jgi:hypothetical protein
MSPGCPTAGRAEDQLEQQSPGLFVMVSSKTYTILCSTARDLTIH